MYGVNKLLLLLLLLDQSYKKAANTAEKSGTVVSKKEYGPHIFARVNNPYPVLGMGTDPCFCWFWALVYGPKNQKKTRVRTSFLILTSVCVTISLMTCAVKEKLIRSPKNWSVNATFLTWPLCLPLSDL